MLTDKIGYDIIIICACSWAIAQILKVFIILIQEKRLAWEFFINSGGMPSAHSATVTSLATSIGLLVGLDTIAFAISVVLAVIVMYDAAGVRQSVGQHSALLNRIVREIRFKSKFELERELREFIGHTPSQVVVGGLLGICVSILWMLFIKSI